MSFIKSLSITLTALSCLITQLCSSEQHLQDEQQDQETGIFFRLDKFGNPHTTDTNFQNSDDLITFAGRLTDFYESNKERYVKKAFMVRIPRSYARVTEGLKDSIFSFYFGNNQYEVWIHVNESPMPSAFTAIGGAFALVFNEKGDVLIVADRFRKQKVGDAYIHSLWIPGGSIDKGELPCVAAAREVLEETGVIAQVQQPLYMCSRTNGNIYGANDSMQVFYASAKKDNLHPQESEIAHAVFVNPQIILNTDEGEVISFDGHSYYIGGFVYRVLKHFMGKRAASYEIVEDPFSPGCQMARTYFSID